MKETFDLMCEKEDLWGLVSYKGTSPQEIAEICTAGYWLGGGGVVTEDQPFKVFEFSRNGGDWVIGSEFLDSGGMRAKARSPICQDIERNNG